MKLWEKVFLVMAVFFFMSVVSANAENATKQGQINLTIKNNLITINAEDVSFKDILQQLQKQSSVKFEIDNGVKDKKITVNIKDHPLYDLESLLKKMFIQNFAIFLDPTLSSKVVYILTTRQKCG
jgi:type II secretory pathway component GspD/PulD (secretin)